MNYQQVIDEIFQQVKLEERSGKVANYIPELGKIDPEKFGVCLTTVNDEQFHAGDWQESFSIQSVAKVFSLSMAFGLIGEEIWKRVDVEPSGTAFNSILQLEQNQGIPRNPFINSGAIVVCDILMDLLKDPREELLNYIRNLSGNSDINFDPKVAASEKTAGFRNRAMVNYIRSFENIKNDVEKVLDFYFCLCSIEMTCQELSQSFLYLTDHRQNKDGTMVLSLSKSKRINAIMQTCGFYDEAGEFAYRVGLPGKSGVGGGIVAVNPELYSIAVWSPRLNPKGNSRRGMKFLEAFTTQTESSIF